MVIPDPNYNPWKSKSISRPASWKYTARPIDRAAAQIFDVCVVLLPIFLLLSAPFKTRLYHGFLVENQEEIALAAVANFAIGFILFVVYHALCAFFFGSSIGKRLFHLRIVDVWDGKKLGLWRCFGRAAISAFSIFTLGLAFLPVLSNDRRRSLSDLCFESEVISERPTDVTSPNSQEKWMVRAIYGGTAMVLFVSLVIGCHSFLHLTQSEDDLSAWFMDRASHCEAVDDAVAQWPRTDDKKPNRLRVTLAMYAAGLVDRSCLQSEADNEASFSTSPGALYYLAQSFVHSDESDVSDSYLDHVCKKEPDSASCELSQIVSAWSSEDWKAMDEAFSSLKHPDPVVAVWAIRHFMKRGEPEKAYTWMEKISPNRPLGPFLEVQRVKALWLMNRHGEAKLGAVAALESLPDDWQMELATWMCVQETSVSCQAKASSSCRWLAQQKTDLPEDDPDFAVALLHEKECSGEGDLDYSELDHASSSKSWHLLVRAIAKLRAGDRSTGIQLLHDVMKKDSAPDEVKAEAYRRYLAVVDNGALKNLAASAMDIPKGVWREVQPKFAHELAARHLENGREPASVGGTSP